MKKREGEEGLGCVRGEKLNDRRRRNWEVERFRKRERDKDKRRPLGQSRGGEMNVMKRERALEKCKEETMEIISRETHDHTHTHSCAVL